MTSTETLLLCVFAITAIAGAVGAVVLQRTWSRRKRIDSRTQSRQVIALFGLLVAFATLGGATALAVGGDAAKRQAEALAAAAAATPDVRGAAVPSVTVEAEPESEAGEPDEAPATGSRRRGPRNRNDRSKSGNRNSKPSKNIGKSKPASNKTLGADKHPPKPAKPSGARRNSKEPMTVEKSQEGQSSNLRLY